MNKENDATKEQSVGEDKISQQSEETEIEVVTEEINVQPQSESITIGEQQRDGDIDEERDQEAGENKNADSPSSDSSSSSSSHSNRSSSSSSSSDDDDELYTLQQSGQGDASITLDTEELIDELASIRVDNEERDGEGRVLSEAREEREERRRADDNDSSSSSSSSDEDDERGGERRVLAAAREEREERRRAENQDSSSSSSSSDEDDERGGERRVMSAARVEREERRRADNHDSSSSSSSSDEDDERGGERRVMSAVREERRRADNHDSSSSSSSSDEDDERGGERRVMSAAREERRRAESASSSSSSSSEEDDSESRYMLRSPRSRRTQRRRRRRASRRSDSPSSSSSSSSDEDEPMLMDEEDNDADDEREEVAAQSIVQVDKVSVRDEVSAVSEQACSVAAQPMEEEACAIDLGSNQPLSDEYEMDTVQMTHRSAIAMQPTIAVFDNPVKRRREELERVVSMREAKPCRTTMTHFRQPWHINAKGTASTIHEVASSHVRLGDRNAAKRARRLSPTIERTVSCIGRVQTRHTEGVQSRCVDSLDQNAGVKARITKSENIYTNRSVVIFTNQNKDGQTHGDNFNDARREQEQEKVKTTMNIENLPKKANKLNK